MLFDYCQDPREAVQAAKALARNSRKGAAYAIETPFGWRASRRIPLIITGRVLEVVAGEMVHFNIGLDALSV